MLTVKEIQRIVAPICLKYQIKAAWLFGSYARGDATPKSDIDIRMERGHGMGLEYIRFWQELQDALGVDVHLCVKEQLFSFVWEDIQQYEILIYQEGESIC